MDDTSHQNYSLVTIPTAPPKQWINTKDGLLACCQAIAGAEKLALDCEFERRKTYWAQLCLIQIATPNAIFLIDPLTIDDLTPLWEALSRSEAMFMMHDPRQDLEILWHQGNIRINRVFDTQLAAAMIGLRHRISYDDLISEMAEVTLDKSPRLTDWKQRPLSDAQKHYASQDVWPLLHAGKELILRLEKMKRIPWLDEDMQSITNPKSFVTDPKDAWKQVKPRGKGARYLGIIWMMCATRERLAQEKDIPRSWVISDDTLLDVAAQGEKTLHDFVEYHKHPKKEKHRPSTGSDSAPFFASRSLTKLNTLLKINNQDTSSSQNYIAQSFIDAIERALDLSLEDEVIKDIRNTVAQTKHKASPAVVDILKLVIKIEAERLSIAPEITFTTPQLKSIVSSQNLVTVIPHGWRVDAFRDIINAALTSKVMVALGPDGAKLHFS